MSVQILGQENQGVVMNEKDTSSQTMYSVSIPANTLVSGSKLRIRATVHVATAEPPDCAACESTTNPGALTLSTIFEYNYIYGIPTGSLSGNVAGQLNYVDNLGDEEEFIVTVGERSGFFTDYDYPYTIIPGAGGQWELLHAKGTAMEKVNPVILPINYQTQFATQDAQAGHSGHSDEMSYLLQVTLNSPASGDKYGYFSYPDNQTTYIGAIVLFDGWTKNGTNFYGFRTDTTGIYKGQIATGSTQTLYSAGGKKYTDIFATSNFVWGLTNDGGAAVKKLTHTDLSVLTSYTLDTSLVDTVISFSIIDDTVAYIHGTKSGTHKLYHMNFPSNSLNLVGNLPTDSLTNYVTSIMHYRKGYIYLHPKNLGFGTSFVGVLKIGTITCPGTTEPIGT